MNTKWKVPILLLCALSLATIALASSTQFGRLILNVSPEITGAGGDTISNAAAGTWNFGSSALTTSGAVSTGALSCGAITSTGNVSTTGTLTVGNTLTDKNGFVVQGAGLSGTATAKVEDYTILTTDHNKLLTNAGVTSATTVTFTLPAAALGVRFAVAGVVDGATVRIAAPSGDAVGGWMNAEGKTIELVGKGYMAGIAISDASYAVTTFQGTWTQID